MPSTKYEGSSYPTHFLKSRGSVIYFFRKINLECRTKQVTLLRDEMIFYVWFATNKTKHYSIVIFRAPVVTQFIVKV